MTNPIERIKLIKALSDATTALSTAATPIARVLAAKAVGEALTKLGVGEDAPGVDTNDDGLSDDPASPNYRYKDTGYIANSRKELAANMLRVAKQNGQRVRATDIDWNAIESNPRQAADLIVKSNLFGKTDWAALQQAGMDPAAGFLIEKIYASISTEPTSTLPSAMLQSLSGGGMSGARELERAGLLDRESPEAVAQARRDYAIGLETIRERLEPALTVDSVLNVMGEIKDELMGVSLSAEQSDIVSKLEEQHAEKWGAARAARDEQSRIQGEWSAIVNKINGLKFEQSKRTTRGWKPDPALDQQIADLEPKAEAAEKVFRDHQADHPELVGKRRDHGGGYSSHDNDLEWEARGVRKQIEAIRLEARYFNLMGNPLTRAWLSFGQRFLRVLNYRSHRGSDSFGAHVTSARMGKVKDWSWAEKDKPTVVPGRKPTGESINFQLRVAETFERRGGRAVTVGSTMALKDMVGFRDVQSGNWVLRDPASAKFHVEQTAAAMSDMADVLGIDMKHLGLGGRLGMAFGARGSGGKGAARAHYEPVQRVINLTKMGGGGALGHEQFHAIDNILSSLVNGTPGAKREYASANPDLMPAGRIRDAFAKFKTALTTGDRRLTETIEIGPRDRETAKLNIDAANPKRIAQSIKAAGGAEAAVNAVDGFFAGRTDKGSLRNRKQWRSLAAAYYSEDGATSVALPVGRAVSNFMAEAQILDAGSAEKYWSTVEEMAARAFQSYLEDRLAEKDRRNDYLSALADNKFHVDLVLGIEWKPYPEGEERTRINKSLDDLFAVLRDEKVFENATQNKPLLDAIFGPSKDS